jgi:NAD(P)-dependent dehydrogenase (short-subunit alcohol dehydrogenase family)
MSQTGVALVTGGAKRIGRAIALDLATHGWSVAVHFHHSADDAASVVTEISEAGGKAAALGADLAEPRDTEDLIKGATAALGPVTTLVNNASAFERDSIDDFSTELWDAHLDINLRAPAILTKAFAGALPDGHDGNIINLIDQRVWNLTGEFLSYSVSKVGLWGLTQMSAIALAPRIRVNGIGPGPVLPSSRQSAADFARQSAATPMGRSTAPQEICDAVRYILGAPSMTGQMIALDGGAHMTWNTDSAAPLE